MHCELAAVVCSGGSWGKQQTYALLDERVPNSKGFERDTAAAELVRRYLVGHGPATVEDLSWWSSLTGGDLKTALDSLGGKVRSESVGDFTFWVPADTPEAAPRVRGAHLLQVYDEMLVGYTQSRYFGDPRDEDARAAWSNRGFPPNVALVNGRVAGHWRRTIDKNPVRIEISTYGSLSSTAERLAQTEARRFARFIGRSTVVATSWL